MNFTYKCPVVQDYYNLRTDHCRTIIIVILYFLLRMIGFTLQDKKYELQYLFFFTILIVLFQLHLLLFIFITINILIIIAYNRLYTSG